MSQSITFTWPTAELCGYVIVEKHASSIIQYRESSFGKKTFVNTFIIPYSFLKFRWRHRNTSNSFRVHSDQLEKGNQWTWGSSWWWSVLRLSGREVTGSIPRELTVPKCPDEAFLVR